MITSKVINWVVMAAALLLMATYMYLNYQKLLVLTTYWSGFQTGSTAPVVRVKLAEKIVYQRRLNISDIFDVAGNRQVNIMPLPKEIFAKIREELESTRLVIDQQVLSLSSSADKSDLLAVTKDRKIYLVANDTLKPMMTIIWNEQRRAKNIFLCMTRDLCDSVLISSRDWGPVAGPYSDSDFSADRRGMPRGRWALGPKTTLNIQSKIQQRLWLKISLLSVHPDQVVSFTGAAYKAQRVDPASSSLSAGGMSLTPAVHRVLLDLQAGANGLEIHYSIWENPVSESSKPLAAYITAIILEKEKKPELPQS